MRCRPAWSLSTLGSKHACGKNRRSSVTLPSASSHPTPSPPHALQNTLHIKPGIFSCKKLLDRNTRYYGDKILSKNLDLTQDFPNKILFHSLWEQNLVQNLPRIFRLPEMYSFGKILAQDFQMAAITKILMRRENQLRRFFPLGISDKQQT